MPTEAMVPSFPAVGTETASPQGCQGRNEPAQSLPPPGFHPRVWGAVARCLTQRQGTRVCFVWGNMWNYGKEN